MAGFVLVPLRVAAVAGLLLTAGSGALPAQERVGVNSAVNPEATGAPPGAPARRLVIGQDVIFNEHITTTAAGQTQLLFLDESSMTVGPNSDLVIDQFAYDPKSGTGKLAMSATRGLLRYVGGKLSKQDEGVTLRTATATLAVRGGAFIADIGADGTTDAVFLYGKGLTVTGICGATPCAEGQTMTRPGFQIIVGTLGASRPAPVPPGQLALFTQRLDGRSGSSGGAAVVPTDATVTSSGVSQTISGDVTASVQQAAANQGAAPVLQSSLTVPTNVAPQNTAGQVLLTTGPTTTGSLAGVAKTGIGTGLPDQTPSLNVPFGKGALSNGTFSATVGGSVLSFPLTTGTSTFNATGSSSGGMVSGTSFLSSDGAYFYANLNAANGQSFVVSGGQAAPSSVMASTGATRIFAFDVSAAPSPTSVPFSIQDDAIYPKPAVSPLYLVAPASTAIGSTSGGSAARVLQSSLSVTGQGSAQNSTLLVTTGNVGTLQSSGAPVITGVMRGTETTAPGGGPETMYSAVGSVVDANGNSLYGANAITGVTLDHTQFAPGANGTVGQPLASVASESEGVSPSQLQNLESYGFAQPAVATTLPSGVGTSRTTQALAGYFGGLMETTATANPYPIIGTATIATDSAANTVGASFLSNTLNSAATGGVSAITMNFGGQQSAFVDNNVFGANEDPATPQKINGTPLVVNGSSAQASQLYLVSSGTVPLPTSLLPSGASFCQCQFLQWGYWGGQLLTGNSSNGSVSRIDTGQINTWVAGVPTPLGDLNTLMGQSATGTYSGAAIGSVFNNGANYLAAGGFNGSYNFGTQSGAFTVSNFDGHTISATGKAPLTGANYSFGVAQPGVAGSINGTFYGPMAAETGGNFNFHATTGPTYLATGIFAGKH